MPKILIVAATAFEIQPLCEYYHATVDAAGTVIKLNDQVSVLITGLGMVNTAYQLGRIPDGLFTHLINAGVCGSFHAALKTGDVVEVVKDTLTELGAENGDEFLPAVDLNLGATATYYPKNNHGQELNLTQVSAITVNTVHGNDSSISTILSRVQADVESMEGAAFFRACEHLEATCLQLRAVSNPVEKRNKSNWNLPLAIKNLNASLLKYINHLNHEA